VPWQETEEAILQVIMTELQGHGRTAGTDWDSYLASDVAGLLDHLGVGRAGVFGFSLVKEFLDG